jgi:hypothetical protein
MAGASVFCRQSQSPSSNQEMRCSIFALLALAVHLFGAAGDKAERLEKLKAEFSASLVE